MLCSLVLIVGLDLAHDLGVGDFFAAGGRDILITYGVEGVGAFDMLC